MPDVRLVPMGMLGVLQMLRTVIILKQFYHDYWIVLYKNIGNKLKNLYKGKIMYETTFK